MEQYVTITEGQLTSLRKLSESLKAKLQAMQPRKLLEVSPFRAELWVATIHPGVKPECELPGKVPGIV